MTSRIPKKKTTITDVIIVLAVMALTIVSFIIIMKSGNESHYAKIATQDESFYVELNKDDYKFDFESGSYHYTAFIKDGEISVISADCPNRECVMTRAIGKRPGSIVCLPGKMIITCDGEVENVDDADIIVP